MEERKSSRRTSPADVSGDCPDILRLELKASRFLQSAESADELATGLGAILQAFPTIDAGGVYLLEVSDPSFQLKASWGLSDTFVENVRVFDVASAWGENSLRQEPILFHHEHTASDRFDAELCASEKLRAAGIFSIQQDGQTLGAINIASRTHDTFPQAVVEALRAISHDTAVAFSQLLTGRALRKSETRREKLESTHREQDENFKAMAEGTRDGILVLSHRHAAIYINPRIVELTGMTKKRCGAARLVQWLQLPNGGSIRPLIERMKSGAAYVAHREARIIRSDGRTCPIEVSMSRTRWGGQPAILIELRDIGWRRKLQQQVLDAATWERHNLARVLHDGVAQQISAMAFLHKALEAQLSAEDHAAAPRMAELGALLHDGQENLRNFARVLMPSLTIQNLAQGLERLGNMTRALFNIPCSLNGTDALAGIGGQTAHEVYYITQEAVMNAVRHARPQHITVETAPARQNGLSLTIRDDGVGFEPGAVSEDSFGLHLMRYRADNIGGTLTVASAPGRGTVVACTFPLPGKTTRIQRGTRKRVPPRRSRHETQK